MNNHFTDLFFGSPPQPISSEKYRELEIVKKICDVISNTDNKSVYLANYITKTIEYLSEHPLFLCGYDKDEILKMGWSFLEKILSPDDAQMLVEINQKAWDFFSGLAGFEDKLYYSVSYDIFFQHKNGEKILVNQKVVPLLLTERGDMWISLCMVDYTSHREAGNVLLTRKDKNLYYHYDFAKKKLIPYIPKKLTFREGEILRLSMQGYNETSIANQLKLSIFTVRNHRRNALNKLEANNLAHAIGKFNLGL